MTKNLIININDNILSRLAMTAAFILISNSVKFYYFILRDMKMTESVRSRQ